MLEQTLGILFYQKKPKHYTTGNVPLYMRITVNGQRIEIATKQSCNPARWNSQSQREKGTNEATRSLNTYLDTLERQVHEARRKLIEAQKSITAESLKNILTGQEDKPYMLLDVFAEHNRKMSALAGREYAPATVTRYDTTLEHVRSFLKKQYNVSDIDIKSLNYSFASDFEFYLKSERKCNHNSAIKYVGNLRKIVNNCVKSGWLQRDPFFGYKMAKKEVIREFLTQAEIDSLQGKEFAIERLVQVRDLFLFSCYTGLAFLDVFNLTPANIGTGVDGKDWIFTSRQKTETPSRIPLLPPAQAIIARYKEHPKCVNEEKLLPMLSNQKLNAYLKEIADLCGIKKTLTFHIARHTFATTVTLSNGVPIETVSKMLGHRSIRITQHYAKIIDKKVSEDMLLLQEKMQSHLSN
ncbi:MAG: site-specific integrase [Bacteroidetes bacterium]|nr:site-specific integrase [Bacteroidota bacterium]